MNEILICTVGGSHEPVVKAIETIKPDYVCFLCSEKDPTTKKPGSYELITGEGNIIKKERDDEKPTLPNIPTQTELDEAHYEVKIIPADDLGKAFEIIGTRLQELTEEHPVASFYADYTGGTKSMTAALVVAALDHEKINLQVVTGPRDNLVIVRSNLGKAAVIDAESIRIPRAVKQFTDSWQQFAYSETAKGLAGLRIHSTPLANQVRTLEHLSEAFAAWDRFDHKSAKEIIDIYKAKFAPDHRNFLDSIKDLTTDNSKRREPALLLDLWFNALRRAEQKRFDDAVARLYRLVEWTAQWILKKHCGIDNTNDIPKDKIPRRFSISQNRRGGYQAGLIQAWQLIGCLRPESRPGKFSKENLKTLRDKMKIRNFSILAHGYQPIDEQNWREFQRWFKGDFLELLEQEAKDAGIRSLPQQLPQQTWPEIKNL